MKPSVAYGRTGALMLRDFAVTVPVDVDTIDFYVPHRITDNIQVFLVLKDVNTGLVEVAELKETKDDFDKPVFRLPLSTALRLSNATCDMTLVVLDVATATHTESNPVRVILKTEHYKLAREMAIVSELSAEARKYYEAIVQALKEVIMKGENN